MVIVIVEVIDTVIGMDMTTGNCHRNGNVNVNGYGRGNIHSYGHGQGNA